MNAAYGTYMNIFNDNGIDVFLIFPEWEIDKEYMNKIEECVISFLNSEDRLGYDGNTKEQLQYFLQNNCDNYDIQVIVG